MTRLYVKPKAAVAWNEQTEKLKEKIFSLTDANLYFEQAKLDEMILKLRKKVQNPSMSYIKL
jgi:hypothetical protein